MLTIKIIGFKKLKKVGMTKVIRMHLGLNLAESKAITDKLLATGFVSIDAPNIDVANALATSLKAANANVEIE